MNKIIIKYYYIGIISLSFILFPTNISNAQTNVVSLSETNHGNASINVKNISNHITKTSQDFGPNTYTWQISGSSSWQDLQNYLPKAKINGIPILISLLPPSECPPINPNGNYSEPFRLDFITWAREIAKLSLRYSNLKGFTIEDLQVNLSQGYLTQSYIDKINVEVTSINPKLKFNLSDSSKIPLPPTNFMATLKNVNTNPYLPYELTYSIYNTWQNWEMHTIPNKQRASIVANPHIDSINSSPSVGRIRIFYNDNYSNVANGTPRAEFSKDAYFNFDYGGTYRITWDDYLPLSFVSDSTTPKHNYTYLVQCFSTGMQGAVLVLYQDMNQYAFTQRIAGIYYNKTNFGNINSDRGKWQHWELKFYVDSTSNGWAVIRHNGVKVDSNHARTFPQTSNQKFYLKIGLYKSEWHDYPSTQDSIIRYIDNINISKIAPTKTAGSITDFGSSDGNTTDSVSHFIDLKWENPPELKIDSIYIFSNLKNDTTTAYKIAGLKNSISTYRDILKSEKIRYYWLKIKDVNGNISSFSSVAVDTNTIYVPNN